MKDNYPAEAFVLVFRTNILKKDIKSISPLLNSCIHILRWNIDFADVDRVLRIEATHSDCTQVIELVTNAGYTCEELTD